MNVEYTIIRCVQILDDILVVILPWLRWLVVVGFSGLVVLLNGWNVKRPRPPD